MINNLHQLSHFVTNDLRETDDLIFQRPCMMHMPGADQREIDILQKKLPELPSSYLQVIKKYNLNGITIGYFCVSPFSYKPEGISFSLIKAHDDPFFPKAFLERHKLYQVGSYNTDLVYVTTGTDQFANGEVLFVDEGFDIYNPQDSQVHPLAKDFEQFLIIAGNLNQVQREIHEDESNYEEKKQEFLDRLKHLGINEKYHDIWLSLF